MHLLSVNCRFAEFPYNYQQLLKPVHLAGNVMRIAADTVCPCLHNLCMEGYGQENDY